MTKHDQNGWLQSWLCISAGHTLEFVHTIRGVMSAFDDISRSLILIITKWQTYLPVSQWVVAMTDTNVNRDHGPIVKLGTIEWSSLGLQTSESRGELLKVTVFRFFITSHELKDDRTKYEELYYTSSVLLEWGRFCAFMLFLVSNLFLTIINKLSASEFYVLDRTIVIPNLNIDAQVTLREWKSDKIVQVWRRL